MWLWKHRLTFDGEGLAFLAVAALITRKGPAKDAGPFLRAYMFSDIPERLREIQSEIYVKLGDRKKYSERFMRLVPKHGPHFRREPFGIFRAAVKALPLSLRLELFPPFAGLFKRESGMFRLALDFGKKWTGEPEVAARALCQFAVLGFNPGVLAEGVKSLKGNPIVRAMVYGDKDGGATTRLGKIVVRRARKILRREGYAKERVDQYMRGAEAFSEVQADWGGDMHDAFLNGVGGKHGFYYRETFHRAVYPFAKAMGMSQKRGRKPILRPEYEPRERIRTDPTRDGSFRYKSRRR